MTETIIKPTQINNRREVTSSHSSNPSIDIFNNAQFVKDLSAAEHKRSAESYPLQMILFVCSCFKHLFHLFPVNRYTHRQDSIPG